MRSDSTGPRTFQAKLLTVLRQPRVTLLLLVSWSLLAGVTQLFVNSPVFLDIHNIELDGALGGFALSLNAIPLALLYLYCVRNPDKYPQVFWLALVQESVMVAGNLYQLIIGTFSFESIAIPLVGSVALAALCFAQIFQPRSPEGPANSQAPPA